MNLQYGFIRLVSAYARSLTIAKTRPHRKQLLAEVPFVYGDSAVYAAKEILDDLLPVLDDFKDLIYKEADARRRNNEMSKR